MSSFELAQLNIGRALAPLDSPALAGFMGNLDRINALADAAPGFVWRLQTQDGNASALRIFDDETLVNMSVWRDVEALQTFVYRTAHVEVMARRKAWFERMTEAYMVLWWVPRGHRPPLEEAEERLTHLRVHGPTPHAFSFKQPHPAPDAAGEAPSGFEGACPAS